MLSTPELVPAIPIWTVRDICTVLDGSANPDCLSRAIHGISINTRSIKAGDPFIALHGETHDGHDFVAEAFAKGACAAVVHHGWQAPSICTDGVLIRVHDTTESLQVLGIAGRAQTQAHVIAITGSVGKTTTKEMVRVALGSCGSVFATTGNLNNHLGVPLSLARLPQAVDYAVLELGMNHAGEIAALSRLVQPHSTIITAIEAVHLENFASIDGIADAKAEIFLGQDSNGYALLNRDTPHYARLADHARQCGVTNCLTFGHHPQATGRILNVQNDDTWLTLAVALPERKPVSVRLATSNDALAMSAAAALLVVHHVGGDVARAAAALSDWQPASGRGEVQTISCAEGGVITVIDDSYNASPASMRAAFRALMAQPCVRDGRRIAILGDMLELGNRAPEWHAELADDLKNAGVDTVHTCGALMHTLHTTLPSPIKGLWHPDSGELAAAVAPLIHAGDCVLIKGSRGMRMERVLGFLRDLAILTRG